jgi:hypothetical protein
MSAAAATDGPVAGIIDASCGTVDELLVPEEMN